MDLRLHGRRAEFQVLPVVGEPRMVVPLDLVQRRGKRHVPEFLVVAVGLPVGGDVHELRPVAVVAEASQKPRGEPLPGIQEVFEGDGARDRPVVEEEVDAPSGREVAEIGAGRVDVRLGPLIRSDLPEPRRLVRRQDGELDVEFRQDVERLQVHRRLGEPHPLGEALKALPEVRDAPDDLRPLVPRVRQRHDHVVVDLRDGGAVPGAPFHALPVRRQYRLVDAGGGERHPGEDGGAEVEAHLGVVAGDIHDALLPVEDARSGVRGVALCRYPLVPVVVREGRILYLHRLKPGVFARRLVKVAVNADEPLLSLLHFRLL